MRPGPSPPLAGDTHSRYSPAWMRTRVPGVASCAARLMVLRGRSALPSLASLAPGDAPSTISVRS